MSPAQAILLFIFATNTAVGSIVFITNPKRSQNQLFLLFSISLAAWVLFVFGITNSQTASAAELGIRGASISGAFIPVTFYLFCQSISAPKLSFLQLCESSKLILTLSAIISLMCGTNFFLNGVIMPTAENGLLVPEADYGRGFIISMFFFPIVLYRTIYVFYRTLKSSKGVARTEMQFALMGMTSALPIAIIIHLVAIVSGSSSPQQYGPLCIIPMNLMIAYGIATKHILDVGTVIRKIVAYTLLTSYLVIVYLGIWILAKHVLFRFAPNGDLLAQITAAVVVAFSMAPVHGRFQKVADRLVTSHAMDVSSTMKKAGDIFQSVTTIDALLQQFSDLLMAALSADDMRILLAEDLGYVQQYPNNGSGTVISLPKTSAVAEMVQETKDTVCGDTLVRLRQTPIVTNVIHELNELNTCVVAGVFAKTELRGVVFFGSRRGGRIYDKNEQDALQLLCNQFAVALENAHLYTEMQDSKIRNEIMLDQLVSGVIVADPERKIALINNEAQRITGLTEGQALGQGIDLLPEPISEALETTLSTQNGLQNTNAVLFSQEEEKSMHVRMGSAYLLGHDQKPMGALLVFTDLAEVKGLEEQVRRADQLSSVGTLAAGMAHEIKNPLVTIKTFTQLLPERHGDADFRNEFSSLVAHEVSRIDGIVNQLLSFSKPSQPLLVPMKLHDTVEKTLKLIQEQMSQKNIALNHNLRAKHDLISGDAELLTQTLVNFNLNAIEAIESDGVITVTTSNCSCRFAHGDNPDNAITKPCIRLQISDTGKGIAQDQLQKIFDPFFTSKSEGTGMGLSVAHGIIQEHHGVIEVDSKLGKGTTFNIYIPVLNEDEAA